jgi:flagellar biosynthetic protein FlhB
VAWFAAGGAINRIVALQSLDPEEGLASGGAIVVSIGVRLAFVLLVLAAIDYGLKRWRHERDLRMTRREVREEMREMHVHESVRQRQREVAGRTN